MKQLSFLFLFILMSCDESVVPFCHEKNALELPEVAGEYSDEKVFDPRQDLIHTIVKVKPRLYVVSRPTIFGPKAAEARFCEVEGKTYATLSGTYNHVIEIELPRIKVAPILWDVGELKKDGIKHSHRLESRGNIGAATVSITRVEDANLKPRDLVKYIDLKRTEYFAKEYWKISK